MKKPWERPQEPEEPDEEESPEMARAMRAYERKLRCFFFYLVAPALGIGCIWLAWLPVRYGQPMPTNPWFFIAAVAGPIALWFVVARLALSAMLMADDQLRTEEEDERQKWLWQQYLKPSATLEGVGFLIGSIHLAIVVMLL